jgi:hypothetical protein
LISRRDKYWYWNWCRCRNLKSRASCTVEKRRSAARKGRRGAASLLQIKSQGMRRSENAREGGAGQKSSPCRTWRTWWPPEKPGLKKLGKLTASNKRAWRARNCVGGRRCQGPLWKKAGGVEGRPCCMARLWAKTKSTMLH